MKNDDDDEDRRFSRCWAAALAIGMSGWHRWRRRNPGSSPRGDRERHVVFALRDGSARARGCRGRRAICRNRPKRTDRRPPAPVAGQARRCEHHRGADHPGHGGIRRPRQPRARQFVRSCPWPGHVEQTSAISSRPAWSGAKAGAGALCGRPDHRCRCRARCWSNPSAGAAPGC